MLPGAALHSSREREPAAGGPDPINYPLNPSARIIVGDFRRFSRQYDKRLPSAKPATRYLEHIRERPWRDIETRFPERPVGAKHVVIAGEQDLSSRLRVGQRPQKQRVFPGVR